MGRALILETTFLVDLERETLRQAPGPASQFLREHPGDRLHLTFTTAGEMAAGTGNDGRRRWSEFLAPFSVLWCDVDVCWHYGRAERYLRDNGALIGANDLWIAATALARDMPLVTRNERHFRRVPGLQVLGYR